MSLLSLNPEQLSAVEHTKGPVLILAGAGSGKTRVLTQRIAYLIDHEKVDPWNILAITFTNKAANEMKERVGQAVGVHSSAVFVATFHSTCVRILRNHAELLGYTSHFSIYDSDDSKTLMKRIVKENQLETRDLKLRTFLNAVSSAKDQLKDPTDFMMENEREYNGDKLSAAYSKYQKALEEANAFDFDDLIMKTVELFKKNPGVLEQYQNRFIYIHVDEYQDTNYAQFVLIRLLAAKHNNLCVVGDDDQSIYRFRGANIRNILDFEKVYPDAFVVKLEQNYRSTQNILNAANGVIHHNRGRKDKSLWSDLGEGEKIRFMQFPTAYDEAVFIADDVERTARAKGLDYSDFAILYRTNAQSRLLEERFVQEGIPYELVGGVNFYARKEIKDILAYLKTVDNAKDEIAVTRIINIPKRGIGTTTVEKFMAFANGHEIGFFEALLRADEVVKGTTLKKIRDFTALIMELRDDAREKTTEDFIADLVDIIDYNNYLNSLLDEALVNDEENERMNNVQELISKAALYDQENENPTLSGFLEEVALVSDIDMTDDTKTRVMLMTLHSAKGLEFPHVYLSGLEESLFPSYQSCIMEDIDPVAMEEERRLAYVGITRAKRHLTLTCARSRMVNGETRYPDVSRFIKEIPIKYLETNESADRLTSRRTGTDFSATSEKAYKSYRNNEFKKEVSRPPLAFSSMPKKGMPAGIKPDYQVGDRVLHIKFGEGTVTALEKEPRDYKVSVRFDTAGDKVMYAAFAKLTRL